MLIVLRTAHAVARDEVVVDLIAASELYATDVRPCLAPHEDRSALLARLVRGA